MKLNYSEPKIFTGGVDISNWSKLTLSEKRTALDKDWFVYFSFRNPTTGKLTKQPFIKAGVNKLKTKRERYAFLRTMQQALFQLLQYGFNPYEDNSDLEKSLFSKEVETSNNSAIKEHQVIKVEKPTIVIPIKEDSQTTSEPESTIAEAFKLTLELKVNMMNKNSFIKYKSKVGLFEKWLKENNYYENPISFITKKIVVQYLNNVLTRSSARNRNNSRTDIASMFQLLEDNELVAHNFVSKIPVLKSVPKRNKTYTPKQENDIFERLQKVDEHLFLFVKFFANCFMRPIEVCRLRVEDLDIQDKKIYVKAKNQPVKIKILPEILLKSLPDLSNLNPKSFLFGRFKFGEEWDAQETNKVSEFSKRFKIIKDHFGLGNEYTMYGYRHTFITKLYRSLREEMTQQETIDTLMRITGHFTLIALEKYLRDIDAELPEDYSKWLS